MTPEQLALLGDNSLSDGARLIGLWVAVQEGGDDGWIELPFDEVRTFLHDYPSDSAIRRHLRMLTASGWVERKPGGKGHGDRFRLGSSSSLKNKTRLQPESKSDRLAPSLSLNGPSSREEGSSTPPESPPGELSTAAEELFAEHDAKMEGCRGPLRDYLAAKVPEPYRQRSYIGTVVGWLDGTDPNVWALPDGSKLPEGERTGVLADALNQLGTVDEDRDRKWRSGDVSNLRNKVNAILRARASPPGRGRHGGRKPPKSRKGVNDLWRTETNA